MTDGGDDAGSDSTSRFYAECYESIVCEGRTGRAVGVAHRVMEKDVVSDYPEVLEVGAGEGFHRRFVRHPWHTYVETDLRFEGPPLVEDLEAGRILRREAADALALPYDDDSFDRVVATCLVLHLPDPEAALHEWRRVVRPGGRITVYVPCEPGVALRSVRAATTARKARALGFRHYDLLLAREHPNHADGVDVRIRHVFGRDRLSVRHWPFPVRSWNLNLFAVYQVDVVGGGHAAPT
jgi:phosphatidylethanolamine/phosphatidyl-N-methylethanolamine N-methyltransferase